MYITIRDRSSKKVAFTRASDGSLTSFNVERSNWVQLKDDVGTAFIPRSQIVTVVTSSHRVVLNFTSSLEMYNRLLFPLKDSIFSDFEALGALASVEITKTDGSLVTAFSSSSAGLEFGYQVTPPPPRPTVAVIGGGIGGLTAAHELAVRGFDVTVYERLDVFGGKARSFGARGSGRGGKGDLPAEHGFRIFADEYGGTRDTMRRIPSAWGGGRTVLDHLTEGDTALFISEGSETSYVIPSHFPRNKKELGITLKYIRTVVAALGSAEVEAFSARVAIVMTTCVERRFKEFENVSWWEFMRADEHSTAYQDLVKMISGNILAANPRNANAHVVRP
jgi:predicted DNA-binding ribbon-helix-helix protein